MNSYILCLDDMKHNIDKIEIDNGYSFNYKKDKGIVTLIDNDLKEKYVLKKFLSIYEFILKRIQEMFDGDPDDTGVSRSINELDRLESILKGEYIKHLKSNDYEAFLNDIKLVRNTLEEEYNKFKKKSIRR